MLNIEKEEIKQEDRVFAMLIYVSSLFFPILGPLLFWILKKDYSKFVNYHGKEYFNFLISYVIYTVVGVILSFILMFAFIGFFLIVLILSGIALLTFICTIIAAVKSYEGERYRIPFAIQFFK